MQQPLVSIIAVCYNQENWVAETLDSIKDQTYNNIQLIIADDGSSDRSKEIIKNWISKNDPSVVFIDHPKNLGLTKNINSAIPFIKGAYYQVFGCDDIMLPDKIEKQVAILEQNNSAGIVYSDMFMMDAAGNNLGYSYYEKHLYKKPAGGNLYGDLIERMIIAAPSVLIRKTILDELEGYNPLLDYEDHDFFLRASKHHQFAYDPGKTVRYRITGESLSTQKRDDMKFFKNCFIIFYTNYDLSKEYSKAFQRRLVFYMKNLYHLKFQKCSSYFLKAFLKTGKRIFLKYGLASIPFYFLKNKPQ